VRFFEEVPSPLAVVQTAPLHSFANKYYQHVEPDLSQQMWQETRADLHTCGGNFDVHTVIVEPSDLHYDPEKFAALLSYYEGPKTAPWIGGGELIVPELRLSIVVKPRTEIIIDDCLYHYANKTFGVRFCTSTCNTEISKKSYLYPGFEWIAKKNFGFVSALC